MKELNQEQIDSLIEKVERTYEDMDKAIQSVNVFLKKLIVRSHASSAFFSW